MSARVPKEVPQSARSRVYWQVWEHPALQPALSCNQKMPKLPGRANGGRLRSWGKAHSNGDHNLCGEASGIPTQMQSHNRCDRVPVEVC